MHVESCGSHMELVGVLMARMISMYQAHHSGCMLRDVSLWLAKSTIIHPVSYDSSKAERIMTLQLYPVATHQSHRNTDMDLHQS